MDQTPNPFDDAFSIQESHAYRTEAGRPVSVSDPTRPPDLFASTAIGAFRGLVLNPGFSCVGAKSVVMTETQRFGVYPALGGAEATAGLCRDLFAFSRVAADAAEDDLLSYVAIFRGPTDADELGFERLLWVQLHKLNLKDAPLHNWDPSVSRDPADPHFGFSFAETAFFVVGLHPNSSRGARRFPWPALVFNPHRQFEHLREAGRWARLQAVIRAREESLQGSLNPNLTEHGTATEARQYSGRAVEPGWLPRFAAWPTPHPPTEPESRIEP